MARTTLCYSVRLQSLTSISEKAYLAKDFSGDTAIIPKNQVFGQDNEVIKSNAFWISAWILEQKDIQYSRKKEAYFYNDTRRMCNTIVSKHIPCKVQPKSDNEIKELKK